MKRWAQIGGLRFLCGALAALTLLGATPAARAETREFDLIVLLDESGSMARTDPDGARIDAAELFLMLCGDRHEVGLMGFSTNVRLLSAVRPMGPGAARARALEELDAVRSSGQWTDIEQALVAALDELQIRGETGRPRAILLTTDGRVDLAEGDEANLASVRRIRGPLATELVQSGVAVYSIAFSGGADRDLLEYLSQATHGLCVSGQSDAELQRLFVRLFEEMAAPQTLPLVDGGALIDASVREATFLVTHAADGPAVRLIPPGGEAVTEADADRRENLRWFAAPRYDLVTVRAPEPGRWRIEPEARSDQDRVIVLTDMDLELTRFRRTVEAGEEQVVGAALMSEGEVVDTPEIRTRLVMRGTLAGAERRSFPLFDDGEHDDALSADGFFGGRFRAPSEPGAYDLEILARAPTVERRIVRTVQVLDRWFRVHALQREVVDPGMSVPVTVEITDPSIPAGAEASFAATIQRPDGVRVEIPAPPVDRTLFSFAYEDTNLPGTYQISVAGTRNLEDGQTVEQVVGPLQFAVRAVAVALPEGPVSPAPTPETPLVEETPTPDATPQVADAATTASAGARSGGAVLAVQIAILVLLAAAVGLLGFVAWRMSASRRAPAAPADPSMAALRRRASDIRREKSEEQAEPEEGEEEASPPEAAPVRPQEEVGDDSEIIPEPGPGEEPTEELSNSVLAEIDAAREESSREKTKAAAPETTTPEEPTPAAGLSDTEEDLLSEIMAEMDEPSEDKPEPAGPVPAPAAAEPAATAPQPEDSPLNGAESDLLAEIMGEVESAVDDSGDNTPRIPDEADDKSDQDAIDDILKQIEGLKD